MHVPDEPRDRIPAREALEDGMPVLVEPPREIAGHARVERAASMVGEDVDVGGLGHAFPDRKSVV